MKKKKTKPSIRMLLARLGRTKEAVAKKLTKLGCRGDRYYADTCPVAEYLGRLYPRTLVDNTEAEYGNLTIQLPPAVKSFVHGFDRGEFPELQRP